MLIRAQIISLSLSDKIFYNIILLLYNITSVAAGGEDAVAHPGPEHHDRGRHQATNTHTGREGGREREREREGERERERERDPSVVEHSRVIIIFICYYYYYYDHYHYHYRPLLRPQCLPPSLSLSLSRACACGRSRVWRTRACMRVLA